ncbi:MAG: hypothetical protein ACRDRZ_07135 [Pseudonocardiaceae bacterium]
MNSTTRPSRSVGPYCALKACTSSRVARTFTAQVRSTSSAVRPTRPPAELRSLAWQLGEHTLESQRVTAPRFRCDIVVDIANGRAAMWNWDGVLRVAPGSYELFHDLVCELVDRACRRAGAALMPFCPWARSGWHHRYGSGR